MTLRRKGGSSLKRRNSPSEKFCSGAMEALSMCVNWARERLEEVQLLGEKGERKLASCNRSSNRQLMCVGDGREGKSCAGDGFVVGNEEV